MHRAMPMPSPVVSCRPARRALRRCGRAFAWCAHAAARAAIRIRCGVRQRAHAGKPRGTAIPRTLARNSLSRCPRGAKQFASSSGSLGFRSCGVRAARWLVREQSGLVFSSLRGNGEAPRRDKAREVAMSFGRPLTPFVQPTTEPPCRRAKPSLFPPPHVVETLIPAGTHWSGILRRGLALRVVDVDGGANLSAVFHRQEDPLERSTWPTR